MKKLFLLLLLILGSCLAQARTVKTGTYPFVYSYMPVTVEGISFQNIPDSMYAVFVHDIRLSLKDVGFEYNAGRGLYVTWDATLPVMKQVNFVQNYGGGAYFTQSTQTMEEVTFRRNYSAYGGGLYAAKALSVTGK